MVKETIFGCVVDVAVLANHGDELHVLLKLSVKYVLMCNPPGAESEWKGVGEAGRGGHGGWNPVSRPVLDGWQAQSEITAGVDDEGDVADVDGTCGVSR